MDRRKRTGVALAAGLLFLFVTEILLLFLAGNSLYKRGKSWRSVTGILLLMGEA